MTASTGKVGRGTAFKIGDGGGPEVFAAVANVKSIALGGRKVDEVDLTHLLSTGNYKENTPGFIDPGTITLDLQFNPTEPTHSGTSGVETLLGGRTFNFVIDFTGAGFAKAFTGKGYVSGNDITVNATDPMSASVTIRVTGALTLATYP